MLLRVYAMKLVVIESPYAGDIERNTLYARRCLRDSLKRGEAPLASHLLYTQPGVLSEDNPVERRQGIDAGHAWIPQVKALVVYQDYGITRGMRWGMKMAMDHGVPIEYRNIGENL